jgi:hypothetical protein
MKLLRKINNINDGSVLSIGKNTAESTFATIILDEKNSDY